MLDIQFIRDNAELVEQKAKQKGYNIDTTKLLELDEKRRKLVAEIEELRQQRNEHADSLKKGKPTEAQIKEGKQFKEKIADHERKLEPVQKQYEEALRKVPNMPLDTVPVGKSEDENVVIRNWGTKPTFSFTPKNHWEIAGAKGWIDKERAAKVAGSRFAYIKGDLVRLQFAIVQFVLDTLTNEETLKKIIQNNKLSVSPRAFEPILPPAIVNTVAYEATTRLDAEEVTYKLADDELWLNASAEHSLCNMYMDESIPEEKLPLRYVGYATSFRREAGTYGKDMEGIIRMHQFDKLEMEVFSDANSGLEEHKFLVAIQEYLMQQLGLPYHVLQKCTADIGRPNAQGIDIEVWLPGQNKYRETHTADYMTDYQARSLRTRTRQKDGKTTLAHTNDATAFALGRILVGIIENGQTEKGSVKIPKVLQPYINGKEELS